jgi:hypothetical protein
MILSGAWLFGCVLFDMVKEDVEAFHDWWVRH